MTHQSTKNNVFGEQWFRKHQRILLWLLNAPLIKYWSRWILRIDCYKKIIGILPNAYFIKGSKKDEYVANFRTHLKFAKRIYYALKPIWWMIHYWDTLFANQLIPQWDLGFDTLTVFPDPNPETTTVDGSVVRSGVTEAWATIIAGAGTGANDSGDGSTGAEAVYIVRADGSNFSRNNRAITLFDTSSLTAGATISAAVASLYGSYVGTFGGGFSTAVNINIYTSTPASNTALANGDYSQIGSVAQCDTPIARASFSTSAYNNFTLNATGRGNISKTVVTKFGWRNANYDVAASTPSGSGGEEEYIAPFWADKTGTGNDPQLVVTYTLAAAGGTSNLTLLGVG